jgi:hypothetical protein
MPGDSTRGMENLNMPGDLIHGKEKKEVNKISVKRLWEPMT